MSPNCHVDCWLNVKHERKCAAALERLVALAGWPTVTWEKPYHDQERGLFRVEGDFGLAVTRRADAVLTTLEALARVTNHCVVSGPRLEPDGSWEMYASADARQVELPQLSSLTVIVYGGAVAAAGP